MRSVANKKILLGITGGIAAYKACELVRLLRGQGHDVRVIMTENAEKFVTPLTLATLSNNEVLRNDYIASNLEATAHISLAQWGDIFIVAPATANFIGKLANGICDDVLTTEALAFSGSIILAPAMNTRMWMKSITQQNIRKLQSQGIEIIDPGIGELACGEVGVGKMANVDEIVKGITSSQDLSEKKVLVTSGPTRTYLDSVRFITNRSSGRMGHAIAEVALKRGAAVTLITGPVDQKFACLSSPLGKVIPVETNSEMAEAMKKEVAGADIVIAAAAVSDFEYQSVKGKLPRSGEKGYLFELQASRDLIGNLDKQLYQVFCGFAAEIGTESERLKRAEIKLKRKKLDLIALNDVSRQDIGFDADQNELTVVDSTGKVISIQKASKQIIAEKLLDVALKVWKDKNDFSQNNRRCKNGRQSGVRSDDGVHS